MTSTDLAHLVDRLATLEAEVIEVQRTLFSLVAVLCTDPVVRDSLSRMLPGQLARTGVTAHNASPQLSALLSLVSAAVADLNADGAPPPG